MTVTPEDRRRFEALVSDRRAPQKHVWRAIIVLATADGCGTAEIMRRSEYLPAPTGGTGPQAAPTWDNGYSPYGLAPAASARRCSHDAGLGVAVGRRTHARLRRQYVLPDMDAAVAPAATAISGRS